MKKTFKRLVMAVAALAVVTAMPFMSACDSDHPEAVITISYNGNDYELKYKLYRNMYPQTVRHFIELADAGFYNGTIIHSYSSSYLYGGGYTYMVDGQVDMENADTLEERYAELMRFSKYGAGILDRLWIEKSYSRKEFYATYCAGQDYVGEVRYIQSYLR